MKKYWDTYYTPWTGLLVVVVVVVTGVVIVVVVAVVVVDCVNFVLGLIVVVEAVVVKGANLVGAIVVVVGQGAWIHAKIEKVDISLQIKQWFWMSK